MAGRLNVNPYRRQDRIAYEAPGRMFDWKYPPGRSAQDRFAQLGASFERLSETFDGFSERLQAAIHRVAEAASVARDAMDQGSYALVDAEGGPADAEEEEGH